MLKYALATLMAAAILTGCTTIHVGKGGTFALVGHTKDGAEAVPASTSMPGSLTEPLISVHSYNGTVMSDVDTKTDTGQSRPADTAAE
jgi:hypothetical protein